MAGKSNFKKLPKLYFGFFPSIGNALLSFCDVTQAFSREKNSISKILNFYGKSHCFTFATFNPSNFTKISIISKIFNFYVNVILWIRLQCAILKNEIRSILKWIVSARRGFLQEGLTHNEPWMTCRRLCWRFVMVSGTFLYEYWNFFFFFFCNFKVCVGNEKTWPITVLFDAFVTCFTYSSYFVIMFEKCFKKFHLQHYERSE